MDRFLAIDAFMRVAESQSFGEARQAFILLSDTLGLSMLVVAMNHAKPPGV